MGRQSTDSIYDTLTSVSTIYFDNEFIEILNEALKLLRKNSNSNLGKLKLLLAHATLLKLYCVASQCKINQLIYDQNATAYDLQKFLCKGLCMFNEIGSKYYACYSRIDVTCGKNKVTLDNYVKDTLFKRMQTINKIKFNNIHFYWYRELHDCRHDMRISKRELTKEWFTPRITFCDIVIDYCMKRLNK